MTSLMTSQRDVKVCLLYSCLNEIVTFSPWMLWHSFTKFHTQMHLGWVQGPVYFQGQRSNNYVTRSQDRSNGCRGVKSISIISQYMQSYWFSKQSKINIIYNISVMTITITMSIILENFGKYAISDCPFILLFPPSAVYMRRWIGSALIREMVSRLFGAKPLPEPVLTYNQLDPWE